MTLFIPSLQSSLTLLLTDRDLDQLHCRPISQMGNYQVCESVLCVELGVFNMWISLKFQLRNCKVSVLLYFGVCCHNVIMCNGIDDTLEQYFIISFSLLL